MRARVGVVGAGWWASDVHLPALRDNPGADLAGICDLDLARARAAAKRFGAPHAVATIDDLLALDLDAVVVATPHDAHHAPAAAALDAGVDVLVEKPMTLAPDEAWDLVRRAEASGAHLHVGYTFPYLPAASRLRGILRGGDLGPLVLVSSLFATSVAHFYGPDGPATYADPDRGGGQLYTQLTHAVALVLWLTGLTPVEVAAHAYAVDAAPTPQGGRRATSRVDLADTLTVRTADGAIMSFATTGSLHDQSQRIEECRFFGADGHAALDTRRGTLVLSRRPDPAHETTGRPGCGGRIRRARNERAAGETGPSSGERGREEPAVPLAAPSAALVATALGQAPVVVSGELGARTVDVLDAARRSIKSGPSETVPPRPKV